MVVRRRLDTGQATDLFAVLLAVDGERLRLRSEDGVELEIAVADVIAAKPVPPRPPRYSEIESLERVGDACWPAPVHEQLGGWALRAAQGEIGADLEVLRLCRAGQSCSRQQGRSQ